MHYGERVIYLQDLAVILMVGLPVSFLPSVVTWHSSHQKTWTLQAVDIAKKVQILLVLVDNHCPIEEKKMLENTTKLRLYMMGIYISVPNSLWFNLHSFRISYYGRFAFSGFATAHIKSYLDYVYTLHK